jgi:hypothetical protein
MLGREVNTPADLMFGDVRNGPPVDIEAYALDLQRATQMAHETARSRLKTSEERMKRDYDLKEFTRSYNLGDFVYVLDTATVKGKCRKLSPSWKGPGIILKKLSPHHYRVKTKSSVMVVNHDRLKHCRDRDIPLWLSRYQEKFRSTPAETVTQPTEGGILHDIPKQNTGASSSPAIGCPNPSQSQGVEETPRTRVVKRRRRGRPRKNRDAIPDSSAKSSDPDLSNADTHCICRKPDDGRLMVQCDQCQGWFHGGVCG